MNKSTLLTFLILAAAPIIGRADGISAGPGTAKLLAGAPLRFEPSGSAFVTRGLRFSSSLQGNRMSLRSHDKAMRITFDGASPSTHLLPGAPLRSSSNVIRGTDRSQWHGAVPNYADLRARNLYPGIDLKYYGNHGDLEYDLVVKPGATARAIRLKIDGAKPELDAAGNLTADFMQKHPVAYQITAGGSRTLIPSRYRKNADGTFGFSLAKYDRTRDLVIDPALTFSGYLYGSSQDTAKAIGHDAKGLLYVAGITLSTDFGIDPNTTQMPGGPQYANNTGGYDIFIAQIDPTVTNANPALFVTYLGGTLDDILNDMFVSPAGLVYVTGYTKSTDFPMQNAYQSSLTGTSDAFVAIVDITQPVGSQLVYSSYLGGGTSAAGNSITADSQGRAYITGTTNSSELPVVNGLPAGLNGSGDAFVSGFDPTLSGTATLFYSTFLGGSSWDIGNGIAAAPDGTLWVVGETFSSDFPVTGNSFQGATNGSADAFIVQLDPIHGGDTPKYATYLGGASIDAAQRVAYLNGSVAVTGYTMSNNFPVQNASQVSYGGAGDVFLAVLNPGATGAQPQLVYSTYYGGSGAEIPTDLCIDSTGAVYVTGYTGSSNLSVSANALGALRTGGQDGFVVKFKTSVAGTPSVSYSSYIASTGTQIPYGIDVDKAGNIYLVGSTTGGIFDALAGAAKPTAIGGVDAFVMGVSPQ